MTTQPGTNRAAAALCRALTYAHTLPLDTARTAAHDAAWRGYRANTGQPEPTATGLATRAGKR